MSDALTPLEDLTLAIVAQDYVLVNAMESEVWELMGNGVSRAQIVQALMSLRERRLVDAYVYDASTEKYIRRRAKRLGDDTWWHASDAGRRASSLA